MSWRKATKAILFSPILLGAVVFLAMLVIWKLPMIWCERQRAIRYLPYAGLAYYGFAVPLLLAAGGLPWWEVLIVVAVFASAGDWLLPDPITFLLNPRRRRAVRLAIEHLERGGGPRPNYGTVSVVGVESARTIVSVALDCGTRPQTRLLLAVADDTASVEELEFEYMSTNHGVPFLR